MILIHSHPYASINWIRFIELVSDRRLSAPVSTPLRRENYITWQASKQVSLLTASRS